MRGKLFLLLLLLFGFRISYAKIILYNRIVNIHSIGYQCGNVKDEFAVKILSLVKNIQLTEQALDDNFQTNSNLNFQNNCKEFLNKQYKLLYLLSTQKDRDSEMKLLRNVIIILNELYDVNPFNKRLNKILEETVGENKEIYLYLSNVFVDK